MHKNAVVTLKELTVGKQKAEEPLMIIKRKKKKETPAMNPDQNLSE